MASRRGARFIKWDSFLQRKTEPSTCVVETHVRYRLTYDTLSWNDTDKSLQFRNNVIIGSREQKGRDKTPAGLTNFFAGCHFLNFALFLRRSLPKNDNSALPGCGKLMRAFMAVTFCPWTVFLASIH